MSLPSVSVHRQRLVDQVNNYTISSACGHVTTSLDIIRRGNPCPICSKPSDGCRLYFMFGISTMADLLQQHYEMKSAESSTIVGVRTDVPIRQLAVAVFYSSLGELLLENFLIYSMKAHDISPDIQDQRLADVSMKQRLDLFREETDLSFDEAVARLPKGPMLNYSELVKSYIEIREKRNRLLHAGNPFVTDIDMPERCFQDAPNLVQMFANLHNMQIVWNCQSNANPV